MKKATKPMQKKVSPAQQQVDFNKRLALFKKDRMAFITSLSKKYEIEQKIQHGKKTQITWIDNLLIYFLRKRGVGIAFIYNDLKK